MSKRKTIYIIVIMSFILSGCAFAYSEKGESAGFIDDDESVEKEENQNMELADFFRMREDCVWVEEAEGKEITKVFFEVTGNMQTKHMVAIDFLNSCYFSHPEWPVEIFDADMELLEDDKHIILDMLSRYSILSWESEYIDAESKADYKRKNQQGTLDDVDGGGGTWALIIQFSDNTIKLTSGNDYTNAKINPADFDKFVEEIIQYGY